MWWKISFLILHMLCVLNKVDFAHAQGRVAPGVPPQHYQQQQYQQPPQQYQQVQHPPPNMHQPNMQQVPQPQQVHHQQHMQQPPPQQQQQPHHHAHHEAKPNQILNAANLQHEREHIAEHIDVPLDTSKMSEQELQFHYFKMHDADNNNKLDGCELIKSLIHWHGSDAESVEVMTDSEIIDLVDPLLKTIDENDDGFVDYIEYKKHTE